ncbi:GNAT family N-acetyltransferase [Nocardioides sp. GY 10127]|uniref:GNAT family N-acetyltransferase n=1 Tax=Nocardioides sp. GY 10127 TaxID=2569762 RepID=UPI0010A8B6E6|nr:GNAT family N-acetyltransferase [Nocardioides sp. GY 10127]TIC85543.1 GNAT family N-acetyltransferase [Nocardioides sp. GY 10127]
MEARAGWGRAAQDRAGLTTDEQAGREVDVVLSDGRRAVVRPAVAADAAALDDLHERVGEDALRRRFFSPSRHAAHVYVARALADPATEALVGCVRGRVVSLGTCALLPDGRAEVAFLVDDEHCGLGLGTLLLEQLARHARERGVARLVAEVLADNAPMLRVLADTARVVGRAVTDGVVTVELTTEAGPAAEVRTDARECRAEACSLRALRQPASVVLVAGPEESRVVVRHLEALAATGFAGSVQVVGVPGAARYLRGAVEVPSLMESSGRPDLVVVVAPASRCVEVVHDAGKIGAQVVVVASGGAADPGLRHGTAERLGEAAREAGVRLVGPGSLGVVVGAGERRVAAHAGASVPGAGGLGLAAESAVVGNLALGLAARDGLGVASFVSLGAAVDVTAEDLLAAWSDDPDIRVAAIQLDTVRDRRHLLRLARRTCVHTPLLVLPGSSPAVRPLLPLLAHAGAVVCTDVDELVETAGVLLRSRALAATPT